MNLTEVKVETDFSISQEHKDEFVKKLAVDLGKNYNWKGKLKGNTITWENSLLTFYGKAQRYINNGKIEVDFTSPENAHITFRFDCTFLLVLCLFALVSGVGYFIYHYNYGDTDTAKTFAIAGPIIAVLNFIPNCLYYRYLMNSSLKKSVSRVLKS